jgi:uncharacterized iron-regulated membrane protein
MKIKSIWLRKIHKWIGLIIGLQFVLWAISGTAMALLDMDEVAGGPMAERPIAPPIVAGNGWARIQQALGGQRVSAVRIRRLPSGAVYQLTTPQGVQLFDVATGAPLSIDAAAAAAIAKATHPANAEIANVAPLRELNLAVRDLELPIWQVDFADEANSSYYVSGSTGELLVRRNDTWRWWDFFWMLHIMDYSERTSFNHPLIITVGFAMGWLAVTGFWLLFRTMWRHDFAWLKARATRDDGAHIRTAKTS